MKAVVIYFVGLIAHLTYGPTGAEKQVAALVYEGSHHPELIVSDAAVLQSDKPFKEVHDALDRKGFTRFDLKDVGVVQILGMSVDHPVSSTQAFKDDVLGLKAAAAGDLKPKVKDENLKSSWLTKVAYAYVELHGGELGVAGYYPLMGSYKRTTATCVPSVVQLSGTSAGDLIEFVSSDGHDLRVRADATIYIRNLPASSLGDHFHEYEKLLDAHQHLGQWTHDGACTTKSPIIDPIPWIHTTGEGVDCTNTHFP